MQDILRSVAVALIALLSAGCAANPPPRLYVLSSPAPESMETRQMAFAARSGSASDAPVSRGAASQPRSATIGIQPVNVAQYLDRQEIIMRRSTNELQVLDNDRWAEPLGANATRTLVDNLTVLLPGYRIAPLPLRTSQRADYELSLDITAFEVDEAGVARLAGDWVLLDASGAERAGGRVNRSITVGSDANGDTIAAALSRNLLEVSHAMAQQIAATSQPRSGAGRPAGRGRAN
jgi:uncharacterized protein